MGCVVGEQSRTESSSRNTTLGRSPGPRGQDGQDLAEGTIHIPHGYQGNGEGPRAQQGCGGREWRERRGRGQEAVSGLGQALLLGGPVFEPFAQKGLSSLLG